MTSNTERKSRGMITILTALVIAAAAAGVIYSADIPATAKTAAFAVLLDVTFFAVAGGSIVAFIKNRRARRGQKLTA